MVKYLFLFGTGKRKKVFERKKPATPARRERAREVKE